MSEPGGVVLPCYYAAVMFLLLELCVISSFIGPIDNSSSSTKNKQDTKNAHM